MSAYRHEQGSSAVVATTQTMADAEVIKATLAAYGYDCWIGPRAPYPSIDFVEGLAVSVVAANEAAVRALLAKLGLGGNDPE
ncbi:MAG: hypothetical protein WAT66_09530 [Actinomycetota bacterium]